MLTLKDIIRSLLKKKVASILVIIQLSISLYMFFQLVIQMGLWDFQDEQFKKHLNLDMNKLVHLNIYNQQESERFEKSFYELQRYIESLKEVKGIGGYDLTRTTFKEVEHNQQFLRMKKQFAEDDLRARYPEVIEFIEVEKGINKIIIPNIIEGRGFKETDFNKDVIPVIAGNGYRDILHLGMKLTEKNSEQQYQVIGFLEKDERWFSDHGYLKFSLTNLDDKFIVPYTYSEQTGFRLAELMARMNKIFYELHDESDFDYVSGLIAQKAELLGLKIESNQVSQEYQEYKQEHKEDIYFTSMVASFIGLMTILGLISVMLSSLMERRKEIGIRIMVGTSKRYIKLLIWGEMFLLTLISTLISLIFSIFNMQETSISQIEKLYREMNHLTFEMIITVIGITLIFSILASIIPIYQFNKMQPSELIGGDD